MTETIDEPVKSPAEILGLTRDIFAATHWTTGFYVSAVATPDGGVKPLACAVGGLRYAALAPMDHALDEAWMATNLRLLGDVTVRGNTEENELIAASYLAALAALLREIYGQLGYEEKLSASGVTPTEDNDPASGFAGDVWEAIAWHEDMIVSWNDDQVDDETDPDERREVAAEVIVPTFDRAIAALNATTTEGGS